MWASWVVGWESRWEVVKRLGAEEVGGMERRRVVEVPRERMASPGEERATTVAGLSPVKGAMRQSRVKCFLLVMFVFFLEEEIVHTWVEAPPVYPVGGDSAEDGTAGDRLGANLLSQLRAAAKVEKDVFPLVSEDVHEIHAAGVRDLDRRDGSDEE